nr:hypothetical protein BaRGS_034421 [Batillaria attramentaria]
MDAENEHFRSYTFMRQKLGDNGKKILQDLQAVFGSKCVGFHVEGVKITVKVGDIVEEKCDFIVNKHKKKIAEKGACVVAIPNMKILHIDLENFKVCVCV